MKEKKAALVMGYWESADIETLHHHTLRWLSQVKFWIDELQFMQNLLDKHFLYFFDKKRADAITPLSIQLGTTSQTELAKIQRAVQLHEVRLASFIKSPTRHEEMTYRAEQAKIEKEMQDYEVAFRHVKSELFKIAEEVLKEEKMKMITA